MNSKRARQQLILVILVKRYRLEQIFEKIDSFCAKSLQNFVANTFNQATTETYKIEQNSSISKNGRYSAHVRVNYHHGTDQDPDLINDYATKMGELITDSDKQVFSYIVNISWLKAIESGQVKGSFFITTVLSTH